MYTGNSKNNRTSTHCLSVYPCVYRELALNAAGIKTDGGLSLCIQGTPPCRRAKNRYRRFIPVYTGNSAYVAVFCSQRPVYPCVYRELKRLNFVTATQYGLSLCIQGTQHQHRSIFDIFRFIPVYTGNSSFLSNKPASNPVYPCVYRELIVSFSFSY